MSIGDVKAELRTGNQSLNQAKTTIEGIGADLAEVSSLALATLHDSQHPEAKEARRALAEATREVKLTLRTVAAAKDGATALLKALG